jgi:hypothetical protein
MGDYVVVNGLRTFFESQGEGEPLLLLHRGLSTVETWSFQTPALAERYHVLMPERRCHGRVVRPDLDGELSYDRMPEDTIAFMETVASTARFSLAVVTRTKNTSQSQARSSVDLRARLLGASWCPSGVGLDSGTVRRLGRGRWRCAPRWPVAVA